MTDLFDAEVGEVDSGVIYLLKLLCVGVRLWEEMSQRRSRWSMPKFKATQGTLHRYILRL